GERAAVRGGERFEPLTCGALVCNRTAHAWLAAYRSPCHPDGLEQHPLARRRLEPLHVDRDLVSGREACRQRHRRQLGGAEQRGEVASDYAGDRFVQRGCPSLELFEL